MRNGYVILPSYGRGCRFATKAWNRRNRASMKTAAKRGAPRSPPGTGGLNQVLSGRAGGVIAAKEEIGAEVHNRENNLSGRLRLPHKALFSLLPKEEPASYEAGQSKNRTS